MGQLGGRHRQRGTLRLLRYVAFFGGEGQVVQYVGAVHDGDSFLAQAEGSVKFDASVMTADEAVRADICRYIDRTELGEGEPRTQPWPPPWLRRL